MTIWRLLVPILALALAFPAGAQDRPGRSGRQATAEQRNGAQPAREQAGSVLRLLPGDSSRDKQIEIRGEPLAYTATAGTLPLYDASGDQSAAVFYTAYVAKDRDPARRPVTFAFNGGPGAASAYLHLGLAGPRIAPLSVTGGGYAALTLTDNPDTWLAFTDLVMIDPVGTGWSRAAKADGEANFRGVQADAESIAKVIALYLNRNSRMASPKYLLGESYGGFRAAKVARALRSEQSLSLSGIVMVSPLLDGGFTFNASRNALTAALALPSYVASELERRGTFDAAAMARAETFALTEYLVALAGPPLSGDKARVFYDRVARATGMPADAVAAARGYVGEIGGKVDGPGGRRLVSIYDGGVTVDDPFPETRTERHVDPILDGVTRAYGSAFVAYARDELGFKTDMTYNLLAGGRWNWGERTGRLGASVDDDLRILLALDPEFRLLVMHGYSDLVTPYGVSRYLLDRLPNGADRARLRVYRGGHMMYLDAGGRRAMTEDAGAFYRRD